VAGLCFVAKVSTLVIFIFLTHGGEIIRRLLLHPKSHLEHTAFALPGSSLTGCHAVDLKAFLFLAWVPPIMLETALCLPMLYKAWKSYTNEDRSPLLCILVRDRYVMRRHSIGQQV
jgi:hypothetical protein